MRSVVTLLVGAMGLWIILGGVRSAARRSAFRRKAVHAEGVVVDTVRRGGRVKNYNAIIEFTASDGKPYRFEGSSSSTRP